MVRLQNHTTAFQLDLVMIEETKQRLMGRVCCRLPFEEGN